MSELRGFGSVEEHDTAVLGSIARRVTEGDTLWVLGDLTANANHVDSALEELAALKCDDLRLISGNHDPVWAGHRESHKWLLKYLSVFRFVAPFARIKLNGMQVLLSHFPYQGGGDHTFEDRYAQYRLPDLGAGAVLVHGHTHLTERISLGPQAGVQLNVCWEAWERPVSDQEVVSLVAALDAGVDRARRA